MYYLWHCFLVVYITRDDAQKKFFYSFILGRKKKYKITYLQLSPSLTYKNWLKLLIISTHQKQNKTKQNKKVKKKRKKKKRERSK
jgi:hypothetical protein